MKIGMISLGCPKNLVDSEVMLGLAQQAGHELTQDPSGADVLVVNTCAFIDSAKKESIEAILEMAQHKKDGSCQRLVVTGCLAERYRDELRAEIPEIDEVLGTGEVPEIVRAIGGVGTRQSSPLTFFRPTMKSPEATVQNAAPGAVNDSAGLQAAISGAPHDAVHPPGAPTYIYDANTPRIFATPRHYAYVKIAEGCDYKCAFCIIPKLRGGYRSRPAGSIVDEARSLAARGVKELLLISQDTTFYGIDRGERGALARLLRELERRRRARVDPPAVPLPHDHRRRHAGGDGRVREGLQVHRPPTSARVESGAEADEAPRHPAEVRRAAQPHPRTCSRRVLPHHLHRRVPRGDRGRRRGALRVHHRPRVRPCRRVHLLPRGRHLGLWPRR